MNATRQTLDNAMHIMQATQTLHDVLHSEYAKSIEDHHNNLQQVDDIYDTCRDNLLDVLDMKMYSIERSVKETLEQQNPQHKMKETLNAIFSKEGVFVDETSFNKNTENLPDIGFCARFQESYRKRLQYERFYPTVYKNVPDSEKYIICVDVYKKFENDDAEGNIKNDFENNYAHIAVMSFLEDNPDEIRIRMVYKKEDRYDDPKEIVFSEWHTSLSDNGIGFRFVV